MGDKVLISVKDNGNGIPQKVLDKIFQPFFTTKPTGQGTGLGLSLAYDIVKAHGGEIKVETKRRRRSGVYYHLIILIMKRILFKVPLLFSFSSFFRYLYLRKIISINR